MSLTADEQASLDWLDDAPSCDIHDCDNAADWWRRCASCNRHDGICDVCLDLLYTAAAIERRTRFVCLGCLETVAANRWRELFDVIPLEDA